jgi:hypothetical protein
MALVYRLEFIDNSTSLNIIVEDNNNNKNYFKVSINKDKDLIQEIEKLPLFDNGNITITLSEVYNNNYNSVELYDTKWKDVIGKMTGKELFDTLKSNVIGLYKLIQNDEVFQAAVNVYLKPSNTGELNGDYFSIMLAKRHLLYKITTLLYISFTIAQKTMCDSEASQNLTYEKATMKYNGLVKLLKDSTNLLLNIDMLNNTNGARAANENVMLSLPPRNV